MTEVCIIGDSHIGALELARSEGGYTGPMPEVTFFGVQQEFADNLRLQGRALVADDEELRRRLVAHSGGRSTIEIDHYDRFVIIGLGLWIGETINFYGQYSCDSIPDPTGRKYRLSDDCFLDALTALVRERTAPRIASWIRSLTDKPIVMVPAPNLGFGLPESDLPYGFPAFHTVLRNGDAAAIAAMYDRLCARVAKACGVEMLPPLREAAENPIFLRRALTMLPDDVTDMPLQRRLNANAHANGHYGALLASALFDHGPASYRNLALNRPARQSSISPWSQPDDAAGAVNGKITGRYGFHTDTEANPWWEVDLGAVAAIHEIRVCNRLDAASGRANSLRVLASRDGEIWDLLYDQAGQEFGGADGRPLRVLLSAQRARHVRLQLAGTEALHLDQVMVYGRIA